jgi:hypothetical protein
MAIAQVLQQHQGFPTTQARLAGPSGNGFRAPEAVAQVRILPGAHDETPLFVGSGADGHDGLLGRRALIAYKNHVVLTHVARFPNG